MKIDSVIETGPRYAELTDSARAMIATLCARYCAAIISPADRGEHAQEFDMLAVHQIMRKDANADAFDHTGGGIFLSYSIHEDKPSGALVFASAGDESLIIYTPDAAGGSDAQENANAIWELCGEDEHLQIASVSPYEGGTPTDAAKVYSAAGNLDIARELLDAECARLFPRSPALNGEQVDALRDGSDAFGMLDDMEARMGFNVTQARCHVIDAHQLLQECSASVAQRIHELCLCLEYGRVMSAFGMSHFGSADEFAMQSKGAAADYARSFSERWDNEGSGISAPYNAGESEDELEDEYAELEEAIERLHESQRDAFARLSSDLVEISNKLATLRALRSNS